MKKIEIAFLIILLMISLVPCSAYGEIENTQYRVELSSYVELAKGRDVKPKVDLFYRTNQRGEYEEISADDYKVEYFRVRLRKGELPKVMENVKKITKIGEYMVVATSKQDETKHSSALFTVIGKRQKLTIKKTRYTFKGKGKRFHLRPKADGDGKGFTFESSDPKVATVSRKGKVSLKGKGTAVITVETLGDKLYQKGRIKVYIKVKSNKTTLKKSVGKKSTDFKKHTF